MSGTITPSAIVVSSAPSQSVLPTGNAVRTYSTITCQASSSLSPDPDNEGPKFSRQFLVNVGLVSTAPTTLGYEQVALYVGCEGSTNSSDIWAINTVTNIDFGSGSYDAYGYELDFDNYSSHRGDDGLASPVGTGLAISGYGQYRNTAAILIAGSYPSTPVTNNWNRGIVFAGDSVAQAALQDYNVTTRFIDLHGDYSTCIDLSNSSAMSGVTLVPILLGSGTYLTAAGAPPATNPPTTVPLIGTDAYNNVIIGSSVSSFAVFRSDLLPITDNSLTLGYSSNRWTAVYAVNGVIQTSDPSLKTDIADAPDATGVVAALKPKVFRWIDGHETKITTIQTQTAQMTEQRPTRQTLYETVNGRVIRREVDATETVSLFDDLPVFDDAGNPVMIAIPERRASDGTVLQAAGQAQVTRLVPRMATIDVPVQTNAPAPSQHLHWGFLAPDVAAAFSAAGLDFGGVTTGNPGEGGLNYSEMVAVLWRAVQALTTRVQVLEARP